MKTSITALFMNASLLNGKGSTRTREERHATFAAFERFAKEQHWGQVTPATLTLKQFRAYIESLRARGVSARSLQNRAAHFRAALKGVGMDAKAQSPEWGNPSLKIESPPGARTGKHEAVSDAHLRAAHSLAATAGERGREFQVLSELQRCLGLRMQEAVQSGLSLAPWQRALQEGRPLEVVAGTKGGRPRSTIVPPTLLPRAREAVAAALQLAAEREAGRLVAAATLQAARDRYRHACADFGLKGALASHGLRYAFAQDRYRAYRDDGLDNSESIRRVSLDLGHGDGRGRYIASVYLRGVAR